MAKNSECQQNSANSKPSALAQLCKLRAEHKTQRIVVESVQSAIHCAETVATLSHDHTRVLALGSRAAFLLPRMDALAALGPQGVWRVWGEQCRWPCSAFKRAADMAAQVGCGGDTGLRLSLRRCTAAQGSEKIKQIVRKWKNKWFCVVICRAMRGIKVVDPQCGSLHEQALVVSVLSTSLRAFKIAHFFMHSATPPTDGPEQQDAKCGALFPISCDD